MLADLGLFEEILVANNADEAKALLATAEPEVLFLDIHLPGKNGFELLESLDEIPQVIFTTAYDQYAIKAFKVNSIDYLLKPITEERFKKSVLKIKQVCKANNLGFHLDGARVWNAVTALDISLSEYVAPFDTISVCLSKGLGAPVGSLLLGSENFIKEATRWRKVTGGGMRQAGMLAAAGKVALTKGAARLHEDHEHAAYLASALDGMAGVTIRPGWTQTNMVWLDFDKDCGAELSAHAKKSNILLSAYGHGCRIVTHCDVDKSDLDKLAGLLGEFLSQ